MSVHHTAGTGFPHGICPKSRIKWVFYTMYLCQLFGHFTMTAFFGHFMVTGESFHVVDRKHLQLQRFTQNSCHEVHNRRSSTEYFRITRTFVSCLHGAMINIPSLTEITQIKHSPTLKLHAFNSGYRFTRYTTF